MVIKNWIKKRDKSDYVLYKNKHGAVLEMHKGSFKDSEFWTVDASYNDGFGRKYFETRETKEEARRLALAYMRSHPIGI